MTADDIQTSIQNMNIDWPDNFKILSRAISTETVNVTANQNSRMIDSTRSTVKMHCPPLHSDSTALQASVLATYIP